MILFADHVVIKHMATRGWNQLDTMRKIAPPVYTVSNTRGWCICPHYRYLVFMSSLSLYNYQMNAYNGLFYLFCLYKSFETKHM